MPSCCESQRDVTDVGTTQPFDLTGNVAPPPNSGAIEIDPALSALAGQTVTVAGVPASAATGAPALVRVRAGREQAQHDRRHARRTLKGSSQQWSNNSSMRGRSSRARR